MNIKRDRQKVARKKLENRNDFPFFSLIIIVACIIPILVIEKETDSFETNVFENIAVAILANYLFVFTLNIPRPLCINDNLIIRESETQTDHPVTISLLVGCPFRGLLRSIYDVKCTFTYKIDDGASTNTAIAKTATRDWINHYYRFSFELKDLEGLQIKFWEDYLNVSSNNEIIVTITGLSNNIGGHFYYRKSYPRERIIIGEDCFGILDKRDKSNLSITKGKLKECFEKDGCEREKRFWKAFRQCWEYKKRAINGAYA